MGPERLSAGCFPACRNRRPRPYRVPSGGEDDESESCSPRSGETCRHDFRDDVLSLRAGVLSFAYGARRSPAVFLRRCRAVHESGGARHRLGLDAPVWVQYEKWLFGAVQGDFGISLKYRRPVLEVAGPLVGNTLILGGLAYVLVFALAVALALLCVRYEDSWLDRTLCTAGTVAFYTPAFWLGTMLVLVFSVNLHWLPGSGAYGPGLADDVTDRMRHLILPLAVMVAGHVWYYAGMIRNRLLDEVRRDYVLLARSKGLGRSCVLVRHCLRNVLPGIVGLMAISVPHVLSGTYVAETVFNYPGIGLLSVSSAKYHDYNMLMVMVMLAGFMVIVSSVLAQAVNELIDSRMKSGAQGGA